MQLAPKPKPKPKPKPNPEAEAVSVEDSAGRPLLLKPKWHRTKIRLVECREKVERRAARIDDVTE